MSRIRGKNTGPELALRRALWALGVRGWRLHAKELPGRPDLVFRHLKLAVFVDGAFWHGHGSKFSPGRLSPSWEAKIRANQERDRRTDAALVEAGWKVVRVWDFEIRKDVLAQAVLVRSALEERGWTAPAQDDACL